VALALDSGYESGVSHGAILTLDVQTGKRRWVTETTASAERQELSKVGTQNWGPSGAPVCSTPTIDAKRNLVYVGTGQNAPLPATQLSDAVIALDLASGEIRWHFQAIAGYYPKPGVYALSIDDGDEIWDWPVERGCDSTVFEYFVRTGSYPECSFYYAVSAAPLVANDVLFVGGLDGKVRTLDAGDGRVVWMHATAQKFATINSVAGHGGAIDVAGAIAAGNMIYVQSGYSLFGQLTANHLLAYELD
jgi:outer membrane protein assembly factor BamB